MKRFIVYRQLDKMDCGPSCLRMIARYYGKHYSLQTLRKHCQITKVGVNLKGISDAAKSIGFETQGVRLTCDQLKNSVPLPCILHWNQNHFVVLPPQKFDLNRNPQRIKIVDPALGTFRVDHTSFMRSWKGEGNEQGVALLLAPTQEFYQRSAEPEKKNFSYILRYLIPYRSFLFQLLIGMFLESILSMLAPFMTQSLVDNGIGFHDIGFVYLILFSQVALLAGSVAISVIRSWILLHMSARINISIVSDFLAKLMKLPIRFFDTKVIGDINQRVADHSRIEQFLSTTTLHTFFSVVNLVICSIILGIYSSVILLVFLLGSVLSVGWILIFLRKRRELDYEKFQVLSEGQSSIYEMINGMQDIKINNSEAFHRKDWEENREKLFAINLKALHISQYQNTGSTVFNQLKNILISFVVVKEVINGNMTLGMMLSVSYIIGLLNAPIDQLLGFFQSAQDASISLERLREIQVEENEEKPDQTTPVEDLPSCAGVRAMLSLKNVSFQYNGPDSPLVLDNVNLDIPYGQVTAIVGASGSGKTTLLKLLLKYYEPTAGAIYMGNSKFTDISPKWWRSFCGLVMADGFIFSNSIAHNISLNADIDNPSLLLATKTARIDKFIESLPQKYATKIGNSGNGISSGQRQRILIARAIYKQPEFLFLDEATNALDASNEKAIVENLKEFYRGRTVVVIAHRLSTVKYADQIIVLQNGKVAEVGDHFTLTEKRGNYFQLVKNQLEIES